MQTNYSIVLQTLIYNSLPYLGSYRQSILSSLGYIALLSLSYFIRMGIGCSNQVLGIYKLVEDTMFYHRLIQDDCYETWQNFQWISVTNIILSLDIVVRESSCFWFECNQRYNDSEPALIWVWATLYSKIIFPFEDNF